MGKQGRAGCRAKKRPRFFKVFFPSRHSKQLEISPAFRKHIRCRRPASACFLRGPSRNVWRVDMINNEMGLFFQNGWEAFVRDHSLQAGEFLIFQYEGGSRFSVLIFDATMCEKEDVFDVCSSQGLDSVERSDARGVVTGEHFSCVSAENNSTAAYKRKGEIGGRPARKRSSKAEGKHQRRRYVGAWVSQRRPVTEVEIKRAYQAACSFESTNPFLVRVMKKWDLHYGHMMRVSPSFSRQHLPTNRQMTFWDPMRQPWTVSYISCNGRYFFSGGWRRFALANHLEQDDACVFELVGALEIRVHIFRVVEEVTPLIRKVGPR